MYKLKYILHTGLRRQQMAICYGSLGTGHEGMSKMADGEAEEGKKNAEAIIMCHSLGTRYGTYEG